MRQLVVIYKISGAIITVEALPMEILPYSKSHFNFLLSKIIPVNSQLEYGRLFCLARVSAKEPASTVQGKFECY